MAGTVLILVGYLALLPLAAARGQDPIHPPYAGQLLISAGADTSAGFRWLALPDLQERYLCLTWAEGVLLLPAGTEVTPFGETGLLVPFGANLVGTSAGKRLLFAPGRYRISQPSLLTDGSLSLYITAGELVIEEGRIVYRLRESAGELRAQYLLLAGIVILITVLLMRARSRLRQSRCEES